jgi:hypothetical protein
MPVPKQCGHSPAGGLSFELDGLTFAGSSVSKSPTCDLLLLRFSERLMSCKRYERGDYNIRATRPMKETRMMFFVAPKTAPDLSPANLTRENTIRKIEVIPDVP